MTQNVELDRAIKHVEELMDEYAQVVDHDIPVYDVLEKLKSHLDAIREGVI